MSPKSLEAPELAGSWVEAVTSPVHSEHSPPQAPSTAGPPRLPQAPPRVTTCHTCPKAAAQPGLLPECLGFLLMTVF